MIAALPWQDVVDDAVVERLILAMQRAIAEVASDRASGDGRIEVPAPELTVALTSILATVVEPAPECRTPLGMRRTAETIGKGLLQLMRDVRRMNEAEAIAGGTTH